MNLLASILISMFLLGGFVTCGLGASLSEGHSVPNWALFGGLTMFLAPIAIFIGLLVVSWAMTLSVLVIRGIRRRHDYHLSYCYHTDVVYTGANTSNHR